MLRTVTIQIGNSDDKLTQGIWFEFLTDVDSLLDRFVYQTHFSGGSESMAPWQNYCWVVNVEDDAMAGMFEALQVIRRKYKQDSIAVTIGDTQFMEG